MKRTHPLKRFRALPLHVRMLWILAAFIGIDLLLHLA
jgi:hypothetical protein